MQTEPQRRGDGSPATPPTDDFELPPVQRAVKRFLEDTLVLAHKLEHLELALVRLVLLPFRLVGRLISGRR